jgi:hypothetical protein
MDEEDRKPATEEHEEMMEDIEVKDDVMVEVYNNFALKITLKNYMDEPEFLTMDEFSIWANYFHYLE